MTAIEEMQDKPEIPLDKGKQKADPPSPAPEAIPEAPWRILFAENRTFEHGHNCAKAPHKEKAYQLKRRRRPRLVPTWKPTGQLIQPPATDQKGQQPINEGEKTKEGGWMQWGFQCNPTPSDRLSEKTVSLAELRDFTEYCNTLLLNEIPWKGEYYTWTNKQRGDDRVCSRIDRSITNDEWMLQYGHLTAVYGEPFISDHTPILIPMREAGRNIKVPFRFFNVWIKHPRFKQIVETEWGRNKAIEKMKNIWLKLKGLKPALKQLNLEEFKGITEKMNQARSNLKRIQEELGGEGGAYSDATGKMDPEAIKEELVSFYKSLMGTATSKLPVVNRLTWCIVKNEVPNPDTVKDYRPIACCTVLYKIITKIINSRLQKVMAYIISNAQAWFIPERKIADNIILAHELIKNYGRKDISLRCMIKVDLQKAYDSLELIYLEQVMEGMRFPEKFIKWVMNCIKIVNYSILLNGESVAPFNAAKVLRQ
ncbi:uncharacterized protein LOC142168813 [Nicotiana tabacum]|uniref:Uncharacterized protein LOC142168813 n=1 Tax=Nicotiana tabacum TaxID=4097 RepID=A0AC58SM71_TOBAC